MTILSVLLIAKIENKAMSNMDINDIVAHYENHPSIMAISSLEVSFSLEWFQFRSNIQALCTN